MKRNSAIALLIALSLFCSLSQAQNVGIGTAAPDASALLHINSTSKVS